MSSNEDASNDHNKHSRTEEESTASSNGIHPNMLLHGNGIPALREGSTPKVTKVKFLAHQQGRSTARGSGSAADEAPANETQLDRKRRLNRNNERKKRAKKVLKIEELTSQFHDLTSQNNELKAESTELQERIALVKQYMKEQEEKKPAARQGAAASRFIAGRSAAPTLASTSGGGFSEAQLWTPTPADQFATRRRQNPLGTAGIPQLPLPHAISTVTSPSSIIPAAPATSVAASLQFSAAPASQAAANTATSPSQVNLSLLSREQRVRLLQHELEKQDRILTLIRLHNGTLTDQPRVNDTPSMDWLVFPPGLLSPVQPVRPPRSIPAVAAPTQQNLQFSQGPANTGGLFNMIVSGQPVQPQRAVGAASEVDEFLLRQQLLLAMKKMQNENRNSCMF